MKQLSVYLTEKIVPFSGFAVPRDSMPQIQNLDHFVNYLDHLSVVNSKETSDPNTIKPTQKDYDQSKVNKIVRDIRSGKKSTNKPILVSNDDYVVDGHHRYFAFLAVKTKVNTIRVDLPVNQLLKLAIEYTEAYG